MLPRKSRRRGDAATERQGDGETGRKKLLRQTSPHRPVPLSPRLRLSCREVRQADEFVDARGDGARQDAHFGGRVVGGAEGVADLPVAEARELLAEPARVLDADVVEHAALLAGEVE